MIRRKLLAAAITAAIAAPATAGVQTMTSDEMVETYVEDSAVIVVPKDQQKSEADRQRQPDADFSGGDRHHKKREYLAVRTREVAAVTD